MKVHSIFSSIDGEINHYHQGRVSTFVRLAGCNLRCTYCDTARAWDPASGIEMTPAEVAERVREMGIRKLTITGGEPLLQTSELETLLYELRCFEGEHHVTVETNGSIVPPRWPVSFVVDYKLPSSGHEHLMIRPRDFCNLTSKDWIKFVVSDLADMERAAEVMKFIRGGEKLGTLGGRDVQFAFSPAGASQMLGRSVVEWMLEKRIDAVFSLQIHKILWPEGERGDAYNTK